MSQRASPETLPPPCPHCGTPGHAVGSSTVIARLKPRALARYQVEQHHYCPNPTCPIVYHAPSTTYQGVDLNSRVHTKDPGPDVPICSCFLYTPSHLETYGWNLLPTLEARVKGEETWCTISQASGQPCLNDVRAELLRLHPPIRSARSTRRNEPTPESDDAERD